MNHNRYDWRLSEIEFLKKNYLLMTRKEIKETLGISYGNIESMRRELGLQKTFKWTDEKTERLISLYQGGMTISRISVEFNVNENRIYQKLKKLRKKELISSETRAPMRRITFSRYFPKTHPKAGQPTHFVEKILLGMGVDYFSPDYLAKLKSMNPGKEELCEQFFSTMWDTTVGAQYCGTKFHTIRRGHSWAPGDVISMVIWTGVPYRSPQLVFWNQVEVKRVWRLKIVVPRFVIAHGDSGLTNAVNGPIWKKLAYNDGLSSEDLCDWLGLEDEPIMSGQIICWNDGVSYLDGEFGNKEAHHE